MAFALLALTAALVVAGCSADEPTTEVAGALLATSQIETRAFNGAIKMTPAGGGSDSKALGMDMTFSGAIDTTDDARPKMVLSFTAGGDSTRVVVPGDGKFYLTSGGRSYSMALGAGEASRKQTINPAKIYAALGRATGTFKPSPPLTNAQGQSVRTLSAKVDRGKLCGPVLDAFGDALASSSGFGTQLGAGAGGKGDSKALKGFCEAMLKSDPRVWFGIDRGRVTDVVLSAALEIPLAGEMKLEVSYHEFNQGRPQGGFNPPADATPISSAAQFAGT